MASFRFWPVALLTFLSGAVLAQPPFRPARGSFPEVGDELPDIALVDEQGRKFSTRQLRGRHVVLVFGCLT